MRKLRMKLRLAVTTLSFIIASYTPALAGGYSVDWADVKAWYWEWEVVIGSLMYGPLVVVCILGTYRNYLRDKEVDGYHLPIISRGEAVPPEQVQYKILDTLVAIRGTLEAIFIMLVTGVGLFSMWGMWFLLTP
tara:strand:+ start:283 stop:684 length:402 start_codon:yes stop_codon:yes gene_type:complete